MYRRQFFILILGIYGLYSFGPNKACDYLGSNIGYIQKQTQKAISAQDVNTSRYFAYKALNAIEKSKSQFEACGCDYAAKDLNESLDNLKKATRVSSLKGTRILLERALVNVQGSLEALTEHEEMHTSQYASDLLSINTKDAYYKKMSMQLPVGKALEKKIDIALEAYQNSLDKVVNTVPCKEAYELAQRNFERCELELLKTDLTEAKRYYNLKTKEITAKALKKLEDCKS